MNTFTDECIGQPQLEQQNGWGTLPSELYCERYAESKYIIRTTKQ